MSPARGAEAAALAREWLGTPFCHRASLRGAGADCLGLLRGVWRGLYGCEAEAVPPYGQDWAESGAGAALRDALLRHLRPKPVAEAAVGDVLLFRLLRRGPAKHVGIQTGPAQFVHAHAGHGVIEVPLNEPWRRRIVARFAFPPV